jgi:iron complex outermembrane receptor protein
VLGAEVQQTLSEISNSDNDKGEPDTLRTSDDINAGQYFVFGRYSMHYGGFTLEASASLNFYNYHYRGLYPVEEPALQKQSFHPQVMPRIALSYKVNDNFAWRLSLSRGYSTPTIAEIRPSNNLIYNNLQAENGWNYETGIRLRDRKERVWWDVSLYYYRLQNAIVRATDTVGTEYFRNAGGTRQVGIESQLALWLVMPKEKGFIRGLQLRAGYTYSHFLFSEYESAGEVYSGNRLTGVPINVAVSSLELQLAAGFYLFTQYNYTGELPLNDANTEFADDYHLLQLKAGWKQHFSKISLELYAGIDNLLNQRYSLGNDLNAAAGRYYNPAPERNYYGGMGLQF